MVCLCRCSCITLSSTDTHNADLLWVDSVEILKIVDNSVDIPHTLIRVFKEMRFTSNRTWEGCIIGNGRIPSVCQFLCTEAI